MTDKTLFIHAGGSKAGSTALQEFFYANASQLEGLDFAYEMFGINNGLRLYGMLSSAATTDSELDSLVLSYFGRCNNAICSSEYFQLTEALGWKRLHESTERLGLKLKVIFYVRNVIPFLLSNYDQVIKCSGEWRSFDERAKTAPWHHAVALRIIADALPRENVQVLHFEHEKANLIRGFLDILGIDASFEVDQNEQKRQVNRSLTNEEREVLIAVNKALGEAYSTELSSLLIQANPDLRVEPVLYHKATAEFLLGRFSTEVDWVNNTFFNGQPVVSVLPVQPEKEPLSEKSTIQTAHSIDVEKRVLGWALDKLKTIQSDAEQRLLDILKDAALNVSEKSHPDIPDDFDSVAYLLLNPDVRHAGFNPVQHFILHGKQEGRAYKFAGMQNPV